GAVSWREQVVAGKMPVSTILLWHLGIRLAKVALETASSAPTLSMAGLSQTQSLSQQQVLAPQLQQSLQILQAPMLELLALIQSELQANPTLEEEITEPTIED